MMPTLREAFILYGINNLFTVLCGEERLECRIKGKELKNITQEYNVLAAGDLVLIDKDQQITERLPRKNTIGRFNWKLKKPQTICANVDLGLCVVAAQNPPLHPRFLDRLLIACEKGGVKPLIVINKCDTGLQDIEEIINIYRNLDYDMHFCSALTGEGVEELKQKTQGLRCAFVGSSGVGKSTLLNRLSGKEYQKTAEINKKFNRGNHQTNFSIFIAREEGGFWIDTPGVRDLTPAVEDEEELAHFYPEFALYAEHCQYKQCRHIHEPGCAVKEAIEEGKIHESRYMGYLKLIEEIALKNSDKSRYKKR